MCGTSPGSVETFAEQVCMPINGRVQCIDKCIHHIVASLNAGNVRTMASCCGHQTAPGSILLEDGRCIGVFTSYEAFLAAVNSGSETTDSQQLKAEILPEIGRALEIVGSSNLELSGKLERVKAKLSAV